MFVKMPNNTGHILTDDVVVNYKNSDRDDCLHFLTHIDTSCHDLAAFVSPTAKRVYTSIFNAWFLKINFNVKNMDVQGFDTNKSYKLTYKGNKYIYSFIDAKFSAGSVALLLHGTFGSYLYSGNFCYYPSFVKSPVLLPVIEKKALTRLYLDNTYYEQPSNFLGFEDIASKVVELIKSEPIMNFYIYADKVTMDPLLAEIASRLEEKVYVCQSTMEIMKFFGYESFFTRNSNDSRIFINKTLIKKRDFEQSNVTVYLNRFSDPCKTFKKLEKKGNIYNFNFYCHSNHKEICELLKTL
ncbi:5' exonuclease Apollo [Halyomorpha halys]|uniref:5' exonuclease Apollo n=1 Tax=Halyomorpha halys TaxID=286706 RepID=UPI0006D4E387|nr:5' exonuclease Apollo-like [Halyomorpha halys]